MADDKPAVPQASGDLEIGKVKIPWAVIISLIGLLAGGFGVKQGSDNSDRIDELHRAQVDIVEMKTDIKWIKAKLNGDAIPQTELPQSQPTPYAPAPQTSLPSSK